MPESGSHVEFDGLTEAFRDMDRWADHLDEEVAKQAGPFGENIAGKVRSAVPVLTGTLAGSVESMEANDGLEIGYDGTAPYDAWIEFGGSRGRPAVPEGRYLYPIALDAEQDYYTMAEDAAEQSIERFSWTQRH
jgi:hypothetical protein